MSTVAFNTLGCRLNQYETDALVSDFRRAGYRIVDWNEKADAYIINTCTVTEKSDRKSRALIYQAFRAAQKTAAQPDVALKTGDAHDTGAAGGEGVIATSRSSPVIVVTGCFVENGANKLAQDRRVTYAVDNDRKAHIFSIVDSHLRGEPVDLETIDPDRFAFGDSTGGFHTRKAIKVQDGCDNFCSFCIIPRVRGRAVSRASTDVLAKVSGAIDAGAKEIVITGVNIGRYTDGETRFAGLLRQVLSLEGDFRVRVSSIEPDAGSPRRKDSWESGFLQLLDHPKLCPHLHLCLQSGSDRILKAMGRRYSVSGFLETASALRERRPGFNLTTDIMVGFPGETEEDFVLTLEAVEKAAFSHVHTFPFSARPGTKAAGMQHQVPYDEKTRRAKRVRELSARQGNEYREKMIGTRQCVLVEKIANGVAYGYGENYVPIEVSLTPAGKPAAAAENDFAANTFIPVELTGFRPGKNPVLVGAPCDK